jgi:N-acetylglucosaminyldiphosphoundecaprenol N-acetyl-beta-D-mannosaminyltransferase
MQIESKIYQILGVPFHATTLAETLHDLYHSAREEKQIFCATPNPEICLAAQKDKGFKKLLHQTQLSLADGFGILWAARYTSGKSSLLRWIWTLLTPGKTLKDSPLPERVTGSDVVRELTSKHKDLKYFLLGASQEVNEKLTKKLRKQGVDVVGNYSGTDSEKLEPIIRSMIDASEAQVLFVAFGAPRQERWIDRNLKELKTVKVAMGIGGAFDFLAGKRKRAPKWMQRWGLEWLFRLIIEPRRVKRIFNATVVFPVKVYLEHREGS